MTRIPSAAALLVGLLPLCATAVDPFNGSDGFDAGSISSDWNFQYSIDNSAGHAGTWTQTGGVLQYTSDGPSQSRVLTWNNSTNNSYYDTWHASLWVTNTSATTGYNLIGLQVFPTNDTGYGYYGIYAETGDQFGTNIIWEQSDSSFSPTVYVPTVTETNTTGVYFQVDYNPATHDITLGYNHDGSATYTDYAVFNPGTDWDGTPSDGFSLRILGVSSVDSVTAGTMFADNFQVVPEPSTYALGAGLGALGLAFLRRRRRAA